MKRKKNTTPAAIPGPGSGISRLWIWLGVALVLIFFAVIRLRLLDVPLERDEGEYAYAGQLILKGFPPYQMAHNMKLPGTYAAYAFIMALFGQTIRGIHLGLLLVNAATSVLMFLLARRLFNDAAALVVCASYALLSASSSVLGLAAHANHFVVLFAIAGMLLLWRARERGGKWEYLLSGILLGIAFLMKQPGVLFGVFNGLWLMASACQSRFVAPPLAEKNLSQESGDSRDIACLKKVDAGDITFFFSGMAIPFGLVCISLWGVGLFEKFWFWTFSYARAYTSIMPLSMVPDALENTLPDALAHNEWLWRLAGLGLVLIWIERGTRRIAAWLTGLLVISILAVSPGFYFRRHYFILLLPAFALLIGAVVYSGRKLLDRVRLPSPLLWLPLAVFIGAFGWTVYSQRESFFLATPDELALMNYSDNPFIESPEIALYIHEHTAPEEKIAIIGSEPQIYFYAQRTSATGYIYTYPLMEEQPYAHQMQQEMIQEVEQAAPQYLIFVAHHFSWLMQTNSDPFILQWLEAYRNQHYETVGVVDFVSLAERNIRWDADAADGPQTDNYIEILRRRPEETAGEPAPKS